jgi:putative FmdB family regulatory protein
MPIYAYRCEACGHAKDVLQKISDPVLTVCPSCGAPAFKKQVTAAGFQLKGSGWYVTDFRGGSTPATGTAVGDSASAGKSESAKGDSGKTDSSAAPAPAPAPSSDKSSSSAPAAAPPSTKPASGGQ